MATTQTDHPTLYADAGRILQSTAAQPVRGRGHYGARPRMASVDERLLRAGTLEASISHRAAAGSGSGVAPDRAVRVLRTAADRTEMRWLP